MKSLHAALNDFRQEAGAASVEAVLWIPFFVFCLTLIADGALIFYGQARALEVAEDANRSYAIGELTKDDAIAQIKSRLSRISPNAQAHINNDKGLITTIVTVPTGDLDAVGFVTSLASINMQVISQMVRDYDYGTVQEF